MQEGITLSVIDSVKNARKSRKMLTHEDIREELIAQIDAKTIKQADVARALSIAPARVAEMRKRTRLVQQEEMPLLAKILGLTDDEVTTRSVISVTMIPNLGKVAQGIWLEQSSDEDNAEQEYIAYDRMKGDPSPDDLFAVTPEGTSMNKVFFPDTQLICRRVSFSDAVLANGDYVIVERTAHDLRETTCKQVNIDREGCFWLNSASTDEKFAKPWRIGKPDNGHHQDDEIRVIGKVIRAVRDFENG